MWATARQFTEAVIRELGSIRQEGQSYKSKLLAFVGQALRVVNSNTTNMNICSRGDRKLHIVTLTETTRKDD